jgi:hypothetical protein
VWIGNMQSCTLDVAQPPSPMAATHPHIAARGYGSNATYIYEYSRGLGGVDVPRDVIFTQIIYTSC